jgi:protocatechuate 3,4-dioxygenase beta subunit
MWKLNSLGRGALLALVVLLLAACSAPISETGGEPAILSTANAVFPTAAAGLADSGTAQPSEAAATETPASVGSPTVEILPTAAFDCVPPAALTSAQTEGPYFKAGSPERSSLQEGLPGMKLTLTGYVLDTNCQPVAGALLDFWQADSQGNYDNSGYILRGHQFTDIDGRYKLETVVPGLYPGRTEHIHVKVQAPGGEVLTTQLYFPDVSQNQSDGIFDQSMLVTVDSVSADAMQASFNFIIPAQ